MILEGIIYNNETNEFVFDFEKDDKVNIIKLVEIPIHESKFMNNLYLFGYKFEDDIDGKLKSLFIKELKSESDKLISSRNLFKFISNAISNLDDKINIASYEYFIYPETKGSIINKLLLEAYKYTAPKFNTIELVKNSVKNIEFDKEAFEIYANSKKINRDSKREIIRNMEQIIVDIQHYNYFSIANAIKKPKYRAFFKNFLKFKNEKDQQLFEKIQNTNVLVIDDVNTSGSTLMECLRVLRSLNPSNNITLFTVLGKYNDL